MNIEEKENAEGNKNNPNLNNILSFLINFKKYFANTLFLITVIIYHLSSSFVM